MLTTTEQKYGEVLKALGEVIADKNLTICLHENTIQQLKKQLAAAEQEKETAQRERDDAMKFAADINQQLLDAVCKTERLNEQLAKAEYELGEAIAELTALHERGAK